MRLRSKLRRNMAGEESGAVVLLFALLLLPIAGLMAGAIDFARQLETSHEMQEALDSASLAVARYVQANATSNPAEMETVKAKAKAVGAQMFRANFSPSVGMTAPDPVFTFAGDRVVASADVDFKAAFLGIMGISQLGAAARAEAVIPGRMTAEIVLVLDYSGSMNDNDKYKRMADAAKSFVQKIKDADDERTLVGLVPFSDFVRTEIEGRFVRDVRPQFYHQNFRICISNRDYPYSTLDETPDQGTSGSKWPGIALPTGVLSISGDVSSGLGKALYAGKSLGDLVKGCNIMAARKLVLRDLTNDYQTILDALDEMETHEYTNIALGAEIGWHVLSSNEPFTRGAVASNEDVKKVLILLTDGMQTVPAEGPSGTSLTGANEAIAEVCENMAAAEIEVYTIAYDLEDAFTRGLLSGCASEPTHFFEAGVDSDLSDVFEQIYDDVAESVRLTR